MKNKMVDYEFLVSYYLKSYELTHTEEELLDMMKRMINKENIPEIFSDLKKVDKKVLSAITSKIAIRYIKSEAKEHDYVELLPSIIKVNMKQVREKQNKDKDKDKDKKTYSLKRKLVSGTILALSTLSILGSSKTHKLSVENNTDEVVKEAYFDTEKNTDLSVGTNSQVLNNARLLSNVITPLDDVIEYSSTEKIEKEEKLKLKEEKRRRDILKSYKKCETLEDILKREKELKSLGLTDDDKIYKDCPLSPEIQRFIYEQSIVYGYPVDFTFAIIYTETRGEFNSSGKVSYNYGNNYDMGLTQQNSESSAKMFAKKFNMDYDTACDYIRYNDYVNVVSAFIEYQEIATRRSFDPEEFAGCYNGWLSWRGKSISREYVNIFDVAYYDKYKKYHKIIKR